jgi:type II secretory pathway component PulJ
MWHDVLSQHTHAHQVQQQREQLQQELEASMLQLGRDPTEAHAEASSTAEKLALQMCEQGDARDEGRWWRQQELPAVFGSSSEEAAAQLDVVAQAAGEFVERLAGGQQQEDTWHVQHTL